ncbi:CHAD domain-containing protein [Porticoccaceae bacterium LTM1]|nr:CHAD domain-containing protein [Porticoccaceae bacterium LTM1]
MSQTIKVDEIINKTLTHALAEQVASAVEQLMSVDRAQHLGIHEARIALKRLRALLQLLRPINKRQYKRQNRVVRELAWELAPSRDVQAIAETLDKLCQDDPSLADNEGMIAAAELIERMLAELCSSPKLTDELPRICHHVARQLSNQEKALEIAMDEIQGPEQLLTGMRSTYKQCYKRFKRCSENGASDEMHSWRKHVKYHLYQLQMISGLIDCDITDRIQSLKELSIVLGDDHDCVVLTAWLRRHFEQRHLPTQLIVASAKRSRQLRQRARVLGLRLFSSRPKLFLEELPFSSG